MASKDWTEQQQAFQLWLALPAEMREPKLQKEFAATIGVSENALCDWKRKPGFYEQVRCAVYAELKDSVPEVLHEIARRAKIGEVHFVDRFLSLVGEAAVVAGANATMHVQQNTMTEDEAAALLERSIGLKLTPPPVRTDAA